MHRIRPHLGLTLHILLGSTIGTGSVLAWQHVLAPYQVPQWGLFLIAGATSLLALTLLAEVQHAWARPKPRRAHARPSAITRKET